MNSSMTIGTGLPIGGYLHKGSPKKIVKGRNGRDREQVGDDLKKLLRFSSGQERLAELFRRHYGGLTTEAVRVYLPFPSPERNYDCSYNEYKAGGGLQRRCDGTTILQEKVRSEYTDSKGQTRYTWALKDVDKPCIKTGPKCPTCSLTCKLTVFVEEFYQAGIRQAVVLNTKAVNDQRLLDTLRRENERLAALAPGANISTMPSTFASMPETDFYVRWLLRRVPQTTYKPGTEKVQANGRTVSRETGAQVRSEDWLLHMEICPEWWATAMSRWGMGPYKINPVTGEAESVIKAYMAMAQPMMQMGGGLPPAVQQMLPPAMQMQWGQPAAAPAPELAPVPDPVAEVIGVPLHSTADEPLPPDVADALGEDALFLPRSDSRTAVNRLRAVAEVLGLPDKAIKDAIATLYPGRHSSELAGYHCRQVADLMMQQWAVKQAAPNDEPIFLNLEEAADHWQHQGPTLHDIPNDNERAMAWGAIVQAVPAITTPSKNHSQTYSGFNGV